MTTTTKSKPTTSWDDDASILLVEYGGGDFQVESTYSHKTKTYGYVIYEVWWNWDQTAGFGTFATHAPEFPTEASALDHAVEYIEDRLDYERGQRG